MLKNKEQNLGALEGILHLLPLPNKTSSAASEQIVLWLTFFGDLDNVILSSYYLAFRHERIGARVHPAEAHC